MTDNHVHIGQFEDVYYEPIEIIDIVMSSGMDSMSFSSVSSCIYNIMYLDIEKEIQYLLSRIPYSDDIVRPFFWYVPDYIKQGITLESVFTGIAYKGIKIHPFAQNWDFIDTRHMETLHKLFDYAAQNHLPVLIHTGNNGIDNADRFECFIKEYSNAKCILAHCRPLDTTIKLLQKYNNVYCDTAFTAKTDILKIASLGFKDKVILGSDFPITHFFRIKYPSPDVNSAVSLNTQYMEDIADWEMFTTEFKMKNKEDEI